MFTVPALTGNPNSHPIRTPLFHAKVSSIKSPVPKPFASLSPNAIPNAIPHTQPTMKSPTADSSSSAADCELRPGGMLVQKRDEVAGSEGPIIKIMVHHGPNQRELSVPAQSTFGALKEILAQETGLEPREQRLLFRGKEKDNGEYLHMVGVKDMSKVVLIEDPSGKERKLEQLNKGPEERKLQQSEDKVDPEITKACEAISSVRMEVDKLSERVSALQVAVHGGTKVAEKEFDISTELLMTQLLKLDGIKAEGEAKLRRKNEVRHIQSLVDTLDSLKAKYSNPISSNGNNSSDAVPVNTQWETFETGVGSLIPPHTVPSPTAVTDEWERFD